MNDRTRWTFFFVFGLIVVMLGCFACGDDDSGNPQNGDEDVDLTENVSETEADAEDSLMTRLWGDWQPVGVSIKEMLGVASHMKQNEGEDEDRDFEFSKYDELGQAIVREHFRWNHIEAADDEWDFARVQTQVDMAQQHNVKLIPQVGYDVDWAKTGEGDSSLIPEEYGEFTRKVAEKYCDVIKDYELWNEPNIDVFWEPEPNPQHYGLLVKQAYENIKAVCPDARVSIGGLASYSLDDHFYERWWFLKELYAEHPDIGNYFDVLALHPYSALMSYPPEYDELNGEYQAEGQVLMIEMARDILAEIGKPDVPIWFTEVGWPSLSLGEEACARYMTRSALLASRDRIEAYLWYTFFDSEPEPGALDDFNNYFGLFGYPEDTEQPRREKKTWQAFKNLATVVGDARFVRDLSDDLELPDDVYVLGFLREDGTRLLAAWDGREVPDVKEKVTAAGGVDTTFELVLSLPEDVQEVIVTDSTGAELSRPTVDALSLTVTLDIDVKYIELLTGVER